MAITTHTDQEMLDNTRHTIFEITESGYYETGTAGRKLTRLDLPWLEKLEIKYQKKVDKAAQTAAQKGPALVVFREIS